MKKIKWEVRKWTRALTTKRLGVVLAAHHPEAKKIAWERWPELRPTKDHPFGLQKIDPVDPPKPRQMTAEEAALSRAFLDKINDAMKGGQRGKV